MHSMFETLEGRTLMSVAPVAASPSPMMGSTATIMPLLALPSVLQTLCQDDGSKTGSPATELETLHGERR